MQQERISRSNGPLRASGGIRLRGGRRTRRFLRFSICVVQSEVQSRSNLSNFSSEPLPRKFVAN